MMWPVGNRSMERSAVKLQGILQFLESGHLDITPIKHTRLCVFDVDTVLLL